MPDPTHDLEPRQPPTAWLLLTGQLWPDTVARLSDLLRGYGAITALQRRRLRSDNGISAIRIEVQGSAVPQLLAEDLLVVAPRAELRLRLNTDPITTAVFVSRDQRCLDALLANATGENPAIEISEVISNHDRHHERVTEAGIRYHHIPTQPGDHLAAEARALSHLRYVELIVLAGYHRSLSSHFLHHLDNPVITTRHSVITTGEHAGGPPANGAVVNLIGASAHYLSAGHRLGAAIAEDIDPVPSGTVQRRRYAQQTPAAARVLVQAVQLHHQHRAALVEGETVVFD